MKFSLIIVGAAICVHLSVHVCVCVCDNGIDIFLPSLQWPLVHVYPLPF